MKLFHRKRAKVAEKDRQLEEAEAQGKSPRVVRIILADGRELVQKTYPADIEVTS